MAQKLNQLSGMPQIETAFNGWTSKITIGLVIQNIIDGDVYPAITNVSFDGVIQPLSPEQIKVKPEGQRSFQWLMIHVLNSSLNLATNDVIVYKSKKFKVMGIFDYSLDNYVQYDCIGDYQ